MAKFAKGDKVTVLPDARSAAGHLRDPKEVRTVVDATNWGDHVQLNGSGRPGNLFLAEDLLHVPAALDPKDRHPEQLARVKGSPLDPSKVAITLKRDDYIEAESDGAKIGGKVSHVNENGFVVIDHLGTFAIHHITASPLPDGYRMFILTDHQPAVEPEPRKVYEHPNGDRFWSVNTEHGVMLVNEYGDTDHPADITQPLRPLVVIDPAAVDWQGLQAQISVLVVGAEPFKRAGDILNVVRRELGIVAS